MNVLIPLCKMKILKHLEASLLLLKIIVNKRLSSASFCEGVIVVFKQSDGKHLLFICL
jgi:hypothetical protein